MGSEVWLVVTCTPCVRMAGRCVNLRSSGCYSWSVNIGEPFMLDWGLVEMSDHVTSMVIDIYCTFSTHTKYRMAITLSKSSSVTVQMCSCMSSFFCCSFIVHSPSRVGGGIRPGDQGYLDYKTGIKELQIIWEAGHYMKVFFYCIFSFFVQNW